MIAAVAVDGPSALAVAFLAGLVSFLSPCTLPLLPGYLSYISGVGIDEVQGETAGYRMLGPALLFVAGFSLVFVSLGATASYIGSLLQPYQTTLTRAAGAFIIVMALVMVGVVQIPLLLRTRRFELAGDFGHWTALPLGMAFAFGWTPCIGPVLGAILTLGMSTSGVQHGALLLLIYALGLGMPFLAVALFAGRAFRSLRWFKRYYGLINLGGAAVLAVMGLFLLLDRWTALLGPAMRWYADLNLPF